MKVLVTGATGFVGQHLCKMLCDNSYNVRILARASSNTEYLETLGVEVVSGDIRNKDSVEEAVEGCQHVYHLAAVTSSAAKTLSYSASRKLIHSINVGGTENIAYAASKEKVERFVYGSSAGVYGIIDDPPADERTSTYPNTAYRQSKLMGEKIILGYHVNRGLPAVIVRLSSVVGAGSLIYLGICKAIVSGHFRLIGKGNFCLHGVHVLDAVAALVKCSATPGIEGNCYVIAGHQPVKLNDCTNAIARQLGVTLSERRSPELPFRLFVTFSKIVNRYSGIELPLSHRYEMFVTSRILDISKAQKELNYLPSKSFEQGLMDATDWYKQRGLI